MSNTESVYIQEDGKDGFSSIWGPVIFAGFVIILALLGAVWLQTDSLQQKVDRLERTAWQPPTLAYAPPPIFMAQAQQWCRGSVSACDLKNFDQPSGEGSVRYSLIGAECPTFSIPDGFMAISPVDPQTHGGLTHGLIVKDSPPMCNAVFSHTLAFVVNTFAR